MPNYSSVSTKVTKSVRHNVTDVNVRATLNFRKGKVALSPMYRICLNFAKSCVLSCLSNVDNIKKFTVPFLNYELLKL